MDCDQTAETGNAVSIWPHKTELTVVVVVMMTMMRIDKEEEENKEWEGEQGGGDKREHIVHHYPFQRLPYYTCVPKF